MADATNPERNSYLFKIVTFRHNPQHRDLYDFLCGSDAQIDWPFQGRIHILKGPHNNALAWHTALAECSPHDPTISGNWIEMLPAFSALDLDPKDQDSWRFWHLLCNSTKGDESGRELLVALLETQNEMSSAFADAWSIVDALYKGNARYAYAAKISKAPMLCLVPPSLEPQC